MAAACEDCLRRSWLLGRLAGHIERVNSARRGFRAGELLALDDAALAAAVAPREEASILNAAVREAPDMHERIRAAGCWSVCRHDDAYPEGLRALEASAPHALMLRGDPDRFADVADPGSAVAIVGARRATAYGLDVARELAATLAPSGLAVVSGMALGIDSEAHRGALESEGLTIAVLPAGVDTPYPPSHASLHRQICETGLALSELPPGVPPQRWMFPARNRIIAALAGMTVVVQAGERSGSLITAKIANELGRDVGAVPGEVRLPLSAGTNALVADGAALVDDARVVLERLASLNPHLVPVPTGPPVGDDSLRLALVALEQGLATGDAIATHAGLSGEEAAIALARLELLGYASVGAAGGYARTSQRAPEEREIPE